MSCLGLFGEPRELVQIRSEDPHREVGRRAAEPFVDTHAERCREQHRDARQPFQLLAHVRLDVLEASCALRLEHDQHVGHRVRHRIFGSLGPPGSPHDVLDFGHAPQDVLDPMIQAVDFVERGLRRQHGLQQECAFVELRHEIAANPKSECDARCRDQNRDQRDSLGMAKTAIEHRRVPLLDLAQEGDVLVRSGPRGAQDEGGRDRDERQRQDECRSHGGDDGCREGLIHAALDARHAEERQEHDDDDERREGNRPRHFDGSRERALPAFAPGRCATQPVQNVLDHDDRRVDEQTDRDRQTAERHRVQPDVRAASAGVRPARSTGEW